ncbi:hypothetical protein [Kitasatospora sp. Root107]|uniref:hypothetical protein n=1 Tax=Kitasatospora sp. Root107 TaxID=1736424 RepID=UPI00070C5437|nr:hypothetical protein [Kitasatospora sp. Root107]KQV10744.1 hypothetical protein ASC99_36265 [Kitasatospora sp. Root107]
MAHASRDLTTLGNTLESVTEIATAATRARARLVVASHAQDAEDCRMLLTQLGLITAPHGPHRICVRCGREYDHPGIRRRDRFCSDRCYHSSSGVHQA